MKSSNTVLAASPFRLPDSGLMNLDVPRARDFILNELTQSNKSRRLLTKRANLSVIKQIELPENMFEATNQTSLIDFLEKRTRVMAVSSEVMNSVYYVYYTNFCNL